MEEKYRPISAWGYFGYNLLFSLPVVGIIFLIIFSFNSKNINRRNYARSFFCAYLVTLILLVIAVILAVFVLKLDIAGYIAEINLFN